METLNIPEIVNQFEGKKVLIIGDVMLDTYLWGKVNRISPEAPVPVVSCIKRENRLGGAANVGWNIHALGAEAIMCAVVGNDEKGNSFMELLNGLGITNEGILSLPDRQTTSKVRIIGQNQQLLRVDQEQTDYLSEEKEKQFISHTLSMINNKNIDVIIFQDYDKGAITPGLIEQVTLLAKQKKIPVLVDPKKRNYQLYKNVTVFKPNFKEFTEGLKVELAKNNFEKIFEISRDFLSAKGIDFLLLTLSELGIFVCNRKSYSQVPTHAKDVADVSGAGDTVISVAALCQAIGLDIEKTAKLANLAGGMVCSKVGVVPIEKEWLINY